MGNPLFTYNAVLITGSMCLQCKCPYAGVAALYCLTLDKPQNQTNLLITSRISLESLFPNVCESYSM